MDLYLIQSPSRLIPTLTAERTVWQFGLFVIHHHNHVAVDAAGEMDVVQWMDLSQKRYCLINVL